MSLVFSTFLRGTGGQEAVEDTQVGLFSKVNGESTQSKREMKDQKAEVIFEEDRDLYNIFHTIIKRKSMQ